MPAAAGQFPPPATVRARPLCNRTRVRKEYLMQTTEPRWRERLQRIQSRVDAIRMPRQEGHEPSQDHEWCEVVIDGSRRQIRFHDYHEIYRIPGLYEKLFYEKLKCCSPARVARLLTEVLRDFGPAPEELKVLDVGAGNGMVGEELAALGASAVYGIDIIPEAKQATLRDRPEIYKDYFVADLTDLPEPIEERLRRADLNCLTTVAALGFGDIPPKAFAKALDLLATPGWTAFNIKEDFLNERDGAGFSRLIRQLTRDEVIQVQAYRRYRHRLSMTGKPLHYVAMIARKLKDVPDCFL
jgi:2-polyprenyl-3-methyl-5-hydroxy-6-metoxy-1,4-benzoquinol methylase